MSESAKKKFVQKKLPFAIVSVDKDKASAATPTENLSPNVAAVSRKRKTSAEVAKVKPKKRVTESKEDPAVSEVVDLADSDDDPLLVEVEDDEQNDASIRKDDEKTPTSTPVVEKVVHIKLPSSSKLKKKINMDVKPPTPLNEEDFDDDDSVVHLEKEILSSKKAKKSARKSEKKKKKKASAGEASGVKKALLMSPPAVKPIDEEDETPIDDDVENVENASQKGDASKKEVGEGSKKRLEDANKKEVELMELDDDDSVVEVFGKEAGASKRTANDKPTVKETSSQNSEAVNSLMTGDIIKNGVTNNKAASSDVKETVQKSPPVAEAETAQKSSPQTAEAAQETSPESTTEAAQKSSPADDSINEELIEMLSDDSESSAKNNSINPSGAFNTPTSAKFDIKNMTPKQLARRQEQMARRAEKDLQRQKEKEAKELQRLKEKQARDDAKRKEKEDREKKRQAEQDKRDEEKRLKEEEKKRAADQRDEEKRQKEEEKKRLADQREEEKRQKEEERKRQLELREEEKRKRDEMTKKKELEEENRKKRAAEAFSKFFVPKKKAPDTTAIDDDTSKDSAESFESGSAPKANFMPFQIRERMKVAPLVRRVLTKPQVDNFDAKFNTSMPREKLYVAEIKNPSYVKGRCDKTWPIDDKDDDDVMIVDELEGVGEDIQVDQKLKVRYRAKCLLFVENRRPAYYGTWTKKSSKITARRPFAQDSTFFDYEVDSDEEWEEEEPGESLHGSDSEKEKQQEEEDYEVDNDFFVPHGHLSDEEMQQNDDEVMEDNHPEAQKAKLKILQQEFAAEMKKKTERIKPRLIGCIWMNGDEDENGCSRSDDRDKKYHCSDIIWRILKAREMMTSEEGVKLQEDFEPEIAETEEEVEKTPAPKAPIRAKFTDESVKLLIKLLHYNMNSKRFIIREFQAYRLKNFHKEPDFQEFSVKSVDEKVQEISDYKTCPEEGPMFNKKCWYVKADVIEEHFGDDKPVAPNDWVYTLEKEVKEKKPRASLAAETGKKDEPADKIPVETRPEATEPKPNTAEKPKTPPKQAVTPKPAKKRVQLLMSVPRGEEISQTKKNNLISQYLKGSQPATASKPAEDDDVICID